MNAIARALWAIVPNKGILAYNFAIFCIAISFGTYFVFTIEVRGDETIYNIVHNHAKRYVQFNDETIDSHTDMFAVVRTESKYILQLLELKRQYRDHESRLDDIVDKDDNFISDGRRKRWERRDDELQKDMELLRKKIEGFDAEIIGLQMIATRAR